MNLNFSQTRIKQRKKYESGWASPWIILFVRILHDGEKRRLIQDEGILAVATIALLYKKWCYNVPWGDIQ